MNQKPIYKSCTPGMSDLDFAVKHCNGNSSFISFERLCGVGIKEGIGLKPTERMVGFEITWDGITVYLETAE